MQGPRMRAFRQICTHRLTIYALLRAWIFQVGRDLRKGDVGAFAAYVNMLPP